MRYAEILKQHYCQYQTRTDESGENFTFVIFNPHHRGDLSIRYESTADYQEMTYYFSYQHMHFETDIGALMANVDLILSEAIGAIEFFRGEKNAFGGSISLQDDVVLSADYISRMFGYRPSYLVGLNYKIRSWSGKKDLDAVVMEEDGHVFCKETS